MSNSASLVFNHSDALTYSGLISGSGNLTQTGSAMLTLTGIGSNFTGNVNVSGGTLNLGASSWNTDPTGTVLGNTQLATRSITIGNGGTLVFPLGNTIGAGNSTILTPLVIQQGGIVINTAPTTTVNSNNTIGPLTLSGGTLTGTGGDSSTYGTYDFGSAASETVSVNGATTSVMSITGAGNAYNGFNLATSNTFSVAGPGSLIVYMPLLDRDNNQGPASLTKTGTGLLVFAAANTYTGGTTISAGTLQLGDGGTTGNLTGAIGIGSTLVLDRSDNLSVNNALAGQGALVKTSNDTVTLTGNLTGFMGPITVAHGQLVLTAPATPATTAAYTADSGATLTFQSSTFPMNFASISAMSGGTIQYSNATITNAYLFAPSFGSSAGVHVLSASTTNTFTDVTINAGTPVQIQQNGSALFTNVANYGMINAASGGLVLTGGQNEGGGALTLGGTNNVSNWGNGGTITILRGGLLNNQNSNLTSWGGQILINSGGTLNADRASQGASLDLQDSLLVNNGTILGTTNVGYLATVTGSGAFGSVNLSNSGTLDLIAENANVSELTGVGTVNHSGTGSNTLTVGGGDFAARLRTPAENSPCSRREVASWSSAAATTTPAARMS